METEELAQEVLVEKKITYSIKTGQLEALQHLNMVNMF